MVIFPREIVNENNRLFYSYIMRNAYRLHQGTHRVIKLLLMIH